MSLIRSDFENNEVRIKQCNEILCQRDEQLHAVQCKIGEAHAAISENRFLLNKLDGELSYFEQTNEKHKYNQEHMVRVEHEEFARANDHGVGVNQLQVDLSKLEAEENTLRVELDRMKCNNDQLHQDQVGLSSEIDALNKHVSTLNG